MKYFKVVAKCGHVGRNKYLLKTFYQKAENKKEAAKIVRETARVKHNQKDAIREVEEITLEDYCQGRKVMAEDPYFKVHSKQEQTLLCPGIYETTYEEVKSEESHKKSNFRHIKYEALIKEANKEMRGGYLYE